MADSSLTPEQISQLINETTIELAAVTEEFKRVESEHRVRITRGHEKLATLHKQYAKLLSGEDEPSEAQPNGEAAIKIPPPRSLDLGGLVVRAAARLVLQANGGGPMHYRKVAEEAIKYGYGSENSDLSLDTAATTFRRTMHKTTDVFRSHGEGLYELIRRERILANRNGAT